MGAGGQERTYSGMGDRWKRAERLVWDMIPALWLWITPSKVAAAARCHAALPTTNLGGVQANGTATRMPVRCYRRCRKAHAPDSAFCDQHRALFSAEDVPRHDVDEIERALGHPLTAGERLILAGN